MGVLDFIKNEFIEVIEWEETADDQMVYKYPIQGKQQIKNNAQLIVRPAQLAIFVYEGEIADVFQSGKHTLNTDTMPITTSLENWKYKFDSPFKTDVYFINMKRFINKKWGTIKPIMLRDQDFGILRLRGFGLYSFRVKNEIKFLRETFGSSRFFKVPMVEEHIKGLIVSTVSDTIAEAKIPALDLALNYDEIGEITLSKINEKVGDFGLEISDFAIENLSLPDSVEQAMDKRSEMAALGDLDRYTKYQTAEAIKDAANNEGGGFAGLGAGMAAGAGIGSQMMNSMNNHQTTQVSNTEPCPHCGNSVNENSKFCPHCGKSLVNTCVSCNEPIADNVKFCPHCGTNQNPAIKCPNCGHENIGTPKFCAECGHKFE